MQEKPYNADAVKDRLSEYLQNERDIDNQIERLESLDTRLIGLGAQVITDMPKAHSSSTDRLGDILFKKEQLEREIKEAIEHQRAEQRFFESVLKKVRSSDERAVIRMRYFDRNEWEDIPQMLYGSREDFLEREDTYIRRAFRVHSDAITHMAKIIEAFSEGDRAIPTT